MNFSFPQKILLLSLTILTVSTLYICAFIIGDQRVVNSERWLHHTEQVIATSDHILSLAKDVEGYSRGFVITCDSDYISTLGAVEAASMAAISDLRRLTADNPTQMHRADSLASYMSGRIAISRRMIAIRSDEGLAAAVAYTGTKRGKQYSDHLRLITAGILREENSLLAVRTKINESSHRTFQWLSWGLSGAFIFFAILLLISMANYWRGRRYEGLLKMLNIRLEHKVLERTASIEKYKYFFYHTLDLACFANIDGYFEEVNQNFSKVLGYTSEDLLEKKFIDFIHPDDVASTLKVIEILSQGQDAVHFMNRYKTKEGMYKHLEWNATYNKYTQKIHAIARNVTERIVAIKELAFENKEKGTRAAELVIANEELAYQNREKEKRAAELLIANGELAFQNIEKGKRADELFIANDELIYQNAEKGKRAAELIIANEELAFQNMEKGKRADELATANKELAFQNEEKGKRADELLIANKELLYQNQEKGKRAAELIIANEELAYQNKEKGKRADELLIANKELEAARDAIHMLNEGLENKVTERTAELQSANKELESFSYSVSHDLRAPMVTITGFAQIINNEYAQDFDADLQELFGYIESSSVRMTSIIDDLLNLAKNGTEKLKLEEVNITAIFGDVWNQLLFATPHHAILELEQMPTVYADASMVRQVVVNLLTNAIKYSSKVERPVIEIGYEAHDGRMIMYVQDNGVGFDMKFYDKLFGAFQRLHGASEYEGTGVGLTLVKRIINRHGGEVWAESKINKGATFYFSLPLVAPGKKMSLAGLKCIAKN